ncbi:TetR/AcrR family transcriptional regulator [Nocardioides luteus]|uniref:TetR/AcrR family transcriptional regulator n=1 Tax=Nocardioides luteus TaxID=1844 RepID=UPI0018C9180A|nr:TetR/AcrR family transcriptional regulator [Nocardioides luteus]MBG6097618.1 AcrR family transcriptional regulator [Nocardioides luteus]
MTTPVKGLRAAKVAETQERILDAARALFVRDGYHATALTAVADRARVGHRTVYVRFGTKAALLRSVVDVAIGGDAEQRSVGEREWFQAALTGPALPDRIAALIGGIADLMGRAGDLFEVVLQAQASEPELAEAFQSGRVDTRDLLRRFVRTARDDGLLAEVADPVWQEETVALACQAETYLLLRRTTGWGSGEYRDWLRRTLTEVLAPA